MLSLYQAAGTAAAPLLRRMVARRATQAKEIPGRLGERFGLATLPRPPGRLIWFHAASVGETMSILPVIEEVAKTCAVLLTTGTATSAKLAAERLPSTARHQFIPLDVPAWVQKFLSHWQPGAAVFVESELWPNLLQACDARKIPRYLINARMSARSAKNWRRAKSFARSVLAPFRAVHAQSPADAAQLRSLGLQTILEWGNLKFCTPELPCDPATLAAFQAQLPGPDWLAASTHPGEEERVLQAHKTLLATFPSLITIIVPRHPERGAEIAALANAPRRSLNQPPIPGHPYIADTLGELGLFYRAAPFAFIGNSLIGFGGHNLIEPALLGRPIITGPHTENFTEAATRLHAAGALVEVMDAPTLTAAALAWLTAPEAAQTAGAAARACFAGANDLPARLANLILEPGHNEI